MTYADFIKEIEDYYGAYYNKKVRNMIMKWIMKNINQKELESLFNNIIENMTNQFRNPPDIARIKNCVSEKPITQMMDDANGKDIYSDI